MLQMLLLRLPVLAASYFLSVNKESESWILCQVNCIKRWEAELVVCNLFVIIAWTSLSATENLQNLGSEIIEECSICTQKFTASPENCNKTSSWKFTWWLFSIYTGAFFSCESRIFSDGASKLGGRGES